ncbi:MAG: DUF1579 family protein [Terriglobales bacterium]
MRFAGVMMLAVCVAISTMAMAQEKPAAKTTAKPAAKSGQSAAKSSEKPAAGMQMPKPSPEMQKLTKMMAGTWNTAEKMEPMMGMPASEGKGTATFTRGPGGLSLIQNYSSQGSMGKFSGHGVSYWDDKAKAYSGLWCDSMTPGGCANAGTSKWEGDKLVGTMEMDMGGKKETMRMTYSDIKPDSMLFTMESSENGGPMKKTGTIEYTRAAAAPAAAKPAAEKK